MLAVSWSGYILHPCYWCQQLHEGAENQTQDNHLQKIEEQAEGMFPSSPGISGLTLYMAKSIPFALPHLLRENPCALCCAIIHCLSNTALSRQESCSLLLPSHFVSTKSVRRNTPAKLLRYLWDQSLQPLSLVCKGREIMACVSVQTVLSLLMQTNKQQMPYSHLVLLQHCIWGFKSVKVKPFKMMGPIANVTQSQGYLRSVWYCCTWY